MVQYMLCCEGSCGIVVVAMTVVRVAVVIRKNCLFVYLMVLVVFGTNSRKSAVVVWKNLP